MKTTTLQGYAAVRAKHPDWKHHRLPVWMRGRIRDHLAKQGKKLYRDDYAPDIEEIRGLLDHWGTVGKGEESRLITMPYGIHAKAAIALAKIGGATLTVHDDHGCYGFNTSCYEFAKPAPFFFY